MTVLGAALLDLAHEVPAQALLLHPVERLLRRPVAAQPDLDEVVAADRARFDQAAHRRAVAGEDAERVVGRVGVGIEMDDPDAPRAADLGDRGGRRPGDRVVATEDDRDGAGGGHLEDLAVDHRVGPLHVRRDDVRVAGVDHGQDIERVDVELERMDGTRGVLRLADRAWPEPRARPMADGVIERRPDDGDVHRSAPQLVRFGDPRQLHERDRAHVGRQVEVGVGRELLVPAGVMRELVPGVGVVRVVSHQCLRRRSRQIAAGSSFRLAGGRRRFELSSSRTRHGRW